MKFLTTLMYLTLPTLTVQAQNIVDTSFYHFITTQKLENIKMNISKDSQIIKVNFMHALDTNLTDDTSQLSGPKMVSNYKKIFISYERREDNPIFESISTEHFTSLKKIVIKESYVFSLNKTPIFIYVINDSLPNKMKIIKYNREGKILSQNYYIRNHTTAPYYDITNKENIWLFDISKNEW